jgi:hypothetical protein
MSVGTRKQTSAKICSEIIKIPAVVVGAADKPEFIRLPRPGTRCVHTGLSRTGLAELAIPSKANNYRPPVRAVEIRKRGTARGVWLIRYDSLMQYLASLEKLVA